MVNSKREAAEQSHDPCAKFAYSTPASADIDCVCNDTLTGSKRRLHMNGGCEVDEPDRVLVLHTTNHLPLTHDTGSKRGHFGDVNL